VRARARARKSLRTMPPKKSAAKKTASKKSIKKAASQRPRSPLVLLRAAQRGQQIRHTDRVRVAVWV